jgi:16S rRNA (cytosine967-C5)-methyltransferase
MSASMLPVVKKRAPKNRPSEISPARKAAFDILMAIERGQSHSDDLLRGKAVNALSASDRNLATTLVLGVLRWQIRLDRQLQALLKHPSAKLEPEVLIALRLGAFQILHLDRIPARAAIDESVELTKQAGHRFASGMVNAVLRKLSVGSQAAEKLISVKGTGFRTYIDPAKTMAALAPEVMYPVESPAELALAEAHPAWMVARWASIYGLDVAHALCRHGQSQPILTLRIHDPAVADELAAEGIQLEPGDLLNVARTLVSGEITASAAFTQGRMRIQDEGSQLIAELASCNSYNLNHGTKKILDSCAAPGNKTLILAQRNLKARILACESSPQRFEQLRQRLAPLGDRIECRLADATTFNESSAFDLALVDAPCSGTGTLGRNPEIRHRLRLEDLDRQAERQRSILRAALRAVRAGGRVVYSTCSLEPEENEHVVAAVLAEIPNAHQVSIESSVESLEHEGILIPSGAKRLKDSLTAGGALRLLPGAFRTDGFFVALIEKTA